jgi:hypothetical protein
MKKTAVEWLENQIKNSKHYFNLMKEIQSRGTVAQSNIFEQAKAIEKEQINEAFYDGYYKEELYDSRKYYNETFKQK